MNIPTPTANSRLTAVIPALSGGMDVSRAAWLIGEDMLSDCRNMWWKDGALRTRPGFATTDTVCSAVSSTAQYHTYTDREGWLVMTQLTATGAIHVYGLAPDGSGQTLLWADTSAAATSLCCVPAGGALNEYTLLLYVSDGRVVALHPSAQTAVVMTDGFYEPLLMTDGIPVATTAEKTVTGTLYEPRSLLTDGFRCQFTSDGQGLYYFLPVQGITGVVTVEIARAPGLVETFTLPEGSSATEDTFNVYLNRVTGMFYFRNGTAPVAVADEGLRNNVRIRAALPRTGPSPFVMTFGIWHGGRLFLGGNAACPETVVYSGENNPLYFPETACTAVGDPGNALTAFGRQGEYLVLFKEREVYVLDEADGGPLSPSPVNARVGCDCPRTVALLDNRLVWACADGSVYRLSGLTSLNSRTVTRIGDGVRPLLSGGSRFSALTCDGRYYLLCDDRLLVLTGGDTPAWYRFDWHDAGLTPRFVCERGGQPVIAAEQEGVLWWFTMTGEGDVFPSQGMAVRPVTGVVCTRSYDCGDPATFKQVLGVAVEVSGTVTPAYVTERGTFTDCPHRPDSGGLVRCTPHVARCRRLALRLTGENLTVGSVTLYLRGGMR